MNIPLVFGGIVKVYSYFALPEIFEEYQITDYSVNVNTYIGAINSYHIVAYVEVPEDDFMDLMNNKKVELIRRVQDELSKTRTHCETFIRTGEKIYTLKYSGNTVVGLEIENYSMYHSVLKSVFSFGRG